MTTEDIRVTLDGLFAKDFDKLLKELKKEYDRVNHRNAHLQKTLNQWNRDEEIKRADDMAEYYRTHRLCHLSDKETEKIKSFRERHYQSCGNGSRYVFDLESTGVGTVICVKCPVCDTEVNVTDYDAW